MTVRGWSSVRVVKIWLDLVLVVTGLAILAVLVWAMAAPIVMQLGDPLPVDVSATVAIGEHPAVPRLALEIDEADAPRFHRVRLLWGYGELRAETYDWQLHYLWLGFAMAGALLGLWAIWNLRQVVRTASAGEPFAPANSVRLRRIGLLILLVSVVAPLLEYQLGRHLLNQLTVEGIALTPALRFSKDWILGGLLFLVLASIFRHGTALEKEKALTV